MDLLVFFASVVFCVFIDAGNALRCYQCFADGEEYCDSQKVECPTNLPGYCGNLVGTYSGKRYHHQGCLRVNNCDIAADDFRKFLKLSKNDLFVVDCSSCATDYCNSTNNLYSHTSTGSLLGCLLLAIHHSIV
ncbi:unnamed protein product [Phaedon cochleariae]|uniref:UPAR/Ly6 domain-containing protein n=1 Tax=Phaedon cochleariae TaxID=80249 RepID=A0A9N9SCS8_PHACE|nr:unnamed protein product [Phaedon cochleariae]